MVQSQRPTRTQKNQIANDYEESHPAFAVIGASRVSGNATLFNSDFRHQHYIVIRIRAATVGRGLSSDWIHGGQEYIEVALSESQWATFISTLNVGDGTPCTLVWKDGEYLPSIEYVSDRREQFRGEVNDHIKDAVETIDNMLATGKYSKKDREALEHVRRQVLGNLNFVVDQFDEHAEKTVERMKHEVEAYLTGAVQRAGLTALGASPRVVELIEGEPAEN